MSVSGYYNRDKLLKVGNTYAFRYIKSVVLEDDNRYMVLEDIYGMRHFLEHECFKSYNLVETSDIECRVEKINCTGRIYLEPVHPFYRLGSEYRFNVSSIIETEEGILLSVHDCFNNMLNIKITDQNNLVDKNIVARIESIKKGIPELSFVSSIIDF
jgi:hypothetical protein